MVLSNAERQKRFRQRLKERATGTDLSEQARVAVDLGFSALWAVMVRHADAISSAPEVYSDLPSYMAAVANTPSDALQSMEDWLADDWATSMTDGERELIERAAGIYRAALLKHLPPAIKPAKSRGR